MNFGHCFVAKDRSKMPKENNELCMSVCVAVLHKTQLNQKLFGSIETSFTTAVTSLKLEVTIDQCDQ